MEVADAVAVAMFVTKFGMQVELLVLLLLPAVDAVVFVLVVTAAVGAEIDYAVVVARFVTKLRMLVKLLVLILLSAVDAVAFV